MLVLHEQDVVSRLDVRKIVASIEGAMRQLGASRAQQPSQLRVPLPVDGGDTIFYTAVTSNRALIGVTVSPFIVARLNKGLSPVTAYTLLLSGETGEALALIDSKSMIAARTGATTWVAVKKLARRLDQVAIIGSGQVAEWHLRCLADAPCEAIKMFSTNLSSSNSSARREALLRVDRRVEFVSSVQEAVGNAGVVMLCTSSSSPVLDPACTPADALITSITTDGSLAHEIDPAWIGKLDLYCDYRATTPLVAGEMQLAQQHHGWDVSGLIADLPELLQPGASAGGSEHRRRFFRSVGLGIEDVSAAATLIGMTCE